MHTGASPHTSVGESERKSYAITTPKGHNQAHNMKYVYYGARQESSTGEQTASIRDQARRRRASSFHRSKPRARRSDLYIHRAKSEARQGLEQRPVTRDGAPNIQTPVEEEKRKREAKVKGTGRREYRSNTNVQHQVQHMFDHTTRRRRKRHISKARPSPRRPNV